MSKQNPDHYVTDTGAEVIDLAECLDFCCGNVVKYVVRAGKKTGESKVDDLLKAQYYLLRVIGREKHNEAETGTTPNYRHST